jgi:hypothetical protein
MEEDLIASLTRQVKEEVVENYLTERRIVGLQVEEIESRAEEARFQALKTGRRLSRLAYLTVQPVMLGRLVGLLNIPATSYWNECLEKKFSEGIRLIRVRALTDKGKFRKLLLEAYNRFYQWMEKYRKTYEELNAECRAVNMNIDKFQKNFDLLTILNFLKGLDQVTLDRKRLLGENFTPEELASVDQKLYLPPINFDKLEVPAPLALPRPQLLESGLGELANEIYSRYQDHIRNIMI